MGSPFPRVTHILMEPAACSTLDRTLSGSFPLSFPESVAGTQLDDGFGKDVHAADLCRHPELRALFFDPDDGGVAANPALLAGRKLRWKDQHQFHVGALLHAGFGVEKDSVGADVASMRRLVSAFDRAHAGGKARGDSRSGAAFGVSFHAGSMPTHSTPMPEVGRTFPGPPKTPKLRSGLDVRTLGASDRN